ncbi:envelope biogenesis factor ElyC [Flavobacterium salilacus subsp. salilacus]|uniref:YdcF family protein n=1 Tax=Flavobacterium TaxID=237 RepID=UPI0010750C93|nr:MULTISPECIES: ElyC/SanA/YdcF family protein [Flavobacterium]KAF2517536.1 envelope biogenesis factor ElyC [Flavobacterium salilacus subsp. salilacus]MBE1615684.1 YdcF family protein [Flavobacterium sp. SaA2.13]
MNLFLSPINIFWIATVLALIFYKLKRKKTARLFLIFAVLDMFLFSVTPLPVYLMRNLEQRYAPVKAENIHEKLPVIVLGGGHVNDPDLPNIHQLSEVALSRLTEGVRLYTKMEGTTLILSGYSSKPNETSQAEVMAKTAVSLGVQPKDTIMLTKPANTWEEAIELKKRLGNENKFILVTSASHMARAIQTFKSQGLQPIAAPANFQIKKGPRTVLYNWLPSYSKLKYTEKALHEYVGMWYYKWFKE